MRKYENILDCYATTHGFTRRHEYTKKGAICAQTRLLKDKAADPQIKVSYQSDLSLPVELNQQWRNIDLLQLVHLKQTQTSTHPLERNRSSQCMTLHWFVPVAV